MTKHRLKISMSTKKRHVTSLYFVLFIGGLTSDAMGRRRRIYSIGPGKQAFMKSLACLVFYFMFGFIICYCCKGSMHKNGKPEILEVVYFLVVTLFTIGYGYVSPQTMISKIRIAEFISPQMNTFLFTSESVCEGNSHKLSDQISDAILDALLEQDPESKVSCNTCINTKMIMLFGVIMTKAKVDFEKIVRDTCRNIGFTSPDIGLDANNCEVVVNFETHSPDTAKGVPKPEEIGASGITRVFGYATDETHELMPLTHVLATKIAARLTEVKKNKIVSWLRPDGYIQVTIEYQRENGAIVPLRVHTITISTQHDEAVTNEQIACDLKDLVVKHVVPTQYLDDKTKFYFNPSRRFVIGGPYVHAGFTGEKISIDTYGGWGAHGGVFSGRDPTKVSRSGAYIARQAAKSVVASELAQRCSVEVSYAVGDSQPLSVFVNTYKTGKIPDKDILTLIKEHFDFRPEMIAINLDLNRGGTYQKTSVFGHFGRDDPDFTWEIVKLLRPQA